MEQPPQDNGKQQARLHAARLLRIVLQYIVDFLLERKELAMYLTMSLPLLLFDDSDWPWSAAVIVGSCRGLTFGSIEACG
jgi:hypothetical protein